MEDQNYLQSLTRAWNSILPEGPAQKSSVQNFLKYIGQNRIKNYDYERLVKYLSGPCGPVVHGIQPPTPLQCYRALSEEQKQLFHARVNETFKQIEKIDPESYHSTLNEVNGNQSVHALNGTEQRS